MLLDKDTIKRESTIFIVDDEEQNVALLERLLRREGYRRIHEFRNWPAAWERFGNVQPDLILLDLHMPEPNGFIVLDALQRAIPREVFLPIMVITADVSTEAKKKALVMGAKDFLTKPIDVLEASYRIWNLVHARFLFRALQQAIEPASLE